MSYQLFGAWLCPFTGSLLLRPKLLVLCVPRCLRRVIGSIKSAKKTYIRAGEVPVGLLLFQRKVKRHRIGAATSSKIGWDEHDRFTVTFYAVHLSTMMMAR